MTRSNVVSTKQIHHVNGWVAEQEEKGWKVRDNQSSREFTLHQENPTRWKARGKNWKEERMQKRFPAESLQEAVMLAATFLYPDQRHETETEVPSFTLADAFCIAIKSSQAGEEFKKQKFRYSGYFLDWAAEQGITHWHQLKASHLKAYAISLHQSGKAHKTIKNYIQPVRMTATHLHRDYPEHYHDITTGFRLPHGLGAPATLSKKKCREALTLEEIVKFFKWLEKHPRGQILRPGLLLQGLLGMRVREAAYLTWKNVDFQKGTVTVECEEGHQIKNEESIRLLPLPRILLNELRELPKDSKRVLDVDSLRSCQQGRKPTERGRYYADRMTEALREWRPGTLMSAKELRNSIQTTALLDPGKWNVHLVDRFVGHAPTRMNERHYFANNPERLLEEYRKQIIPLLDEIAD